MPYYEESAQVTTTYIAPQTFTDHVVVIVGGVSIKMRPFQTTNSNGELVVRFDQEVGGVWKIAASTTNPENA